MWRGVGYEIVDPRPIASAAPYTFFLPAQVDSSTVDSGDLVQATIRAVPPASKWGAERLWFTVISVSKDAVEARLESDPDDMPAVPKGTTISLPRAAFIDLLFRDERPKQMATRQYWDRCLVDAIVLQRGQRVDYIYREEPEVREGDRDPDSGWRIRASQEGVTAKEIEELGVEYVALGKVLNEDDSWLHLIDAPVGSRFLREGTAGKWTPETP